MTSLSFRIRTVVLALWVALLGAVLASPLGVLPGAASATPKSTVSTAAPVAMREEPGPIHAGNTFGWYNGGGLVYDEKFVGPLEKRWKVEGPGLVRTQHGMLTLNTFSKGTVSATLNRPGQQYGRWETRLRSRVYGRTGTSYRVLTELVPVKDSKERCGEYNIGLNRYNPGKHKLGLYVRNRPDSLYRSTIRSSFGKDQWHTFAVEVTPKRISWFFDARVVRTETRPDALSGVHFQVRFTMLAKKGKQMKKSRMQMDWLRYWNLGAPNKKSTRAPRLELTEYTLACPPELRASESH